jgi:salicylate hydroxylase
METQGAAARFHRAELLQVLYEKSMGEVHLSHRFVSYEDVGSEVILKFENGVTATCDILVGVDGIRSTVRKFFLEKQGHFMSPSCNPYWSGAYAYRGLIPVEDLQKEFPGHNSCKEAMMVRCHALDLLRRFELNLLQYCGKFKVW